MPFEMRDGYTITIANSLSAAFEPFDGYIVTLHDVPRFTWRVEAPTADEAIRIAHSCYQFDTKRKISNAATVQRIPA